MNKWIAEFELEDGDTMPEHMDLKYKGAIIDFHCRSLEREPTNKNDLGVDCIDKTELLKAMDTWDKFGNDPNEGLIHLRTPALQDRYVPYVKYDDMVNCVKGMSSVTPQLSSGLEKNSQKLEKNFGELDCISRAEVIEEINSVANDAWDEEQMRVDLIAEINALPSVTPIRPKGHWINKQHLFSSCSAECSSCHNRSNGYVFDNGFSLERKYYDYCPNCGSDNREVEK